LTLSDAVVDEIAGRILRGELGPGERLPTERELGDLLGVSRSVVRDAVRTLAARNLVEVRQGAGTVVASPNDAVLVQALMALLMRSDLTVGDVLDARNAVETQIAALAAERGSPKDWAILEDHLERFTDGVTAGDLPVAHKSHLEFHLGILRAVHLPALELMLMPMQHYVLVSSLSVWIDNTSEWEVPSHPPILEALRSGDPNAARDAMKRHFRYSKSKAYDKFRTTPFREAGELGAAMGVSTTSSSV
jgi:DNA-binding FadR family transcriptional regulator